MTRRLLRLSAISVKPISFTCTCNLGTHGRELTKKADASSPSNLQWCFITHHFLLLRHQHNHSRSTCPMLEKFICCPVNNLDPFDRRICTYLYQRWDKNFRPFSRPLVYSSWLSQSWWASVNICVTHSLGENLLLFCHSLQVSLCQKSSPIYEFRW